MAFVAALPHPAQLARSTTAYLLAPAPLDDGVAFLTVPRKLGGPAWMARVSGDRLVVQRTSGGARALVDSGCEVSAECNAVRAPVGDGLEVVYGVPNDGGGGYVARAGATGRSQIVFADESDAGAVLAYAASAGRSVYLAKGAIVSRTAIAAPVTLVRAAATGGDVRGVAASATGVAWVARAGSRGAWRLGVKVGTAAATGADDARPGVRLGTPALGDDGTVAFARRVPLSASSVRFEVVALYPTGAARMIAVSPAVRVRDADLLPRVAIHGTTLVYRLRDGAGGRWEAIFATDLVAGTTRTIARVGRRAARLSDPAVDATRIIWSQADFRAGRFVRSRILRVRAAL
jgi:hypothetical protein